MATGITDPVWTIQSLLSQINLPAKWLTHQNESA